MPRLRPTTDIRPLADFRANLAAVLVDAEAYEAMQDRLELFEDVQVAEEQLARGEGVSHTKAKAAILGRLLR